MGKCKNCENETKNDNVYCSLSCRNIYVNKNLRNYKKIKEALKIKTENLKSNYYKNPKRCKNCDKIIDFEKRRNNYCDSSCVAKFNNKLKKGIKHTFSEEGMNKILNATKIKYKVDEYYENPNRCINCDKILNFSKKHQKTCSITCKKEYHLKNKEDFDLYRFLSKFKFHLKDFPEEFDFNLIEKYGWYKAKNNGNNIDGISRDHMFSVKEGFRRLINPLLIAHPANCELVINKNNQTKWENCSLSLDELLDKIKTFEEKYNRYYSSNIKIYISLDELKEIYLKMPL